MMRTSVLVAIAAGMAVVVLAAQPRAPAKIEPAVAPVAGQHYAPVVPPSMQSTGENPADRAARLAAQIRTDWGADPSCKGNLIARLARFAAKHPDWSDRNLAGVACRKPFVGMTPAMVRAIGAPERINRSSDGVTEHQQWVYGGGYFYFDGPLGGELHMTYWQENQ